MHLKENLEHMKIQIINIEAIKNPSERLHFSSFRKKGFMDNKLMINKFNSLHQLQEGRSTLTPPLHPLHT